MSDELKAWTRKDYSRVLEENAALHAKIARVEALAVEAEAVGWGHDESSVTWAEIRAALKGPA